MVDLSSSLCKRLQEGTTLGDYSIGFYHMGCENQSDPGVPGDPGDS